MTNEYFAGFFDGEGTVDIRFRTTHGGKYFRYELRVQIVQIDVKPLIVLRDKWGGSICKPKNSKTSRWLVSSDQAAKFLRDVRPHLIVKADEADIGLEFAELMSKRERQSLGGKRGFAKNSKERTSKQFLCFKQIRELRAAKGFASHNRNSIHAAQSFLAAA